MAIATKRIQKCLKNERTMFFTFDDGNTAYVEYFPATYVECFDYETGCCVEYYHAAQARITFQSGKSEKFVIIENLCRRMKELNGDLRTWRVVPYA